MKFKIWHFVLAAFLSVAGMADAQDLVLTLQSDNYPNHRGQWTLEQCREWQERYGTIRGVNCPLPPCAAVSQEEAIALSASLGYNSVRWWPSGDTAQEYIRSVEEWAAWADKYDMTVSPVFGFTYAYFNREDKEAALKDLENTVRAVIRHFRGDERIVLWDIWNEPNMNDDKTALMMDWIAKMVQWCQQEGCTQPISASIVWDTGVSTNQASPSGLRQLRENTERLMDVHNYHDYACQDGFNQETPSMVKRLEKLGERPLVCTECMTRTNGSTYARTLTDFAKYNINFYTWGLYACDPNWEVKWSRSTFYNWEPMFHNALYMDGEPYAESEPGWVRNFKFADGKDVDPGAENTEVWDPRRAWKRVHHEPLKGLYASSLAEASAMLVANNSKSEYNTIAVRISCRSYLSDASSVYSQLGSLLVLAESAGMTVIPILLESDNQDVNSTNLQNYVYNMIGRYYSDRRIAGWCIYRQTEAGDASFVSDKMPLVFRKARYAFANQPVFAVPMLDEGVRPSLAESDAANRMWQLSDICAYTAQAGTSSDAWAESIESEYRRPVLFFSVNEVGQHVTALRLNRAEDTERMPAWKAWRWVNRTSVKGISYASMPLALRGLNTMLKSGDREYNSVSVQLDCRSFETSGEKFYQNLDSLLGLAEDLGMTVLPRMLNDKYYSVSTDRMKAYVSGVIGRYASDGRIMGWDLYNKLCATSSSNARADEIIDGLFASAREAHPCQPVFVTPSVSARTFGSDFDYILWLNHGKSEGWNRLQYGNADIRLCYKAWCLSDVISYSSNQTAPHLGWVNSVACKFGRPLFCLEWNPVPASAVQTLAVFSDMQVAWYNSGTLDASLISDFHYIPVSTEH